MLSAESFPQLEGCLFYRNSFVAGGEAFYDFDAGLWGAEMLRKSLDDGNVGLAVVRTGVGPEGDGSSLLDEFFLLAAGFDGEVVDHRYIIARGFTKVGRWFIIGVLDKSLRPRNANFVLWLGSSRFRG